MELKGFIEVTSKTDMYVKYICHYTNIHFINNNGIIDCFMKDKWIRESYEEIKELIKKAQ